MPLPSRVSPVIFVLAGVNGAGKSSVAGELIRRAGLNYFNPDEAAQQIVQESNCSVEDANSLAWQVGKRKLEEAIRDRVSHAFESTLSGSTIPGLLVEAARAGFRVMIWYVGLATPEQHVERVRRRVAAGGHDIPETLIRQRWNRSRQHVVDLIPFVAELKVFDNSADGNPEVQTKSQPPLLLHWRDGKIIEPDPADLSHAPDWAKPIVETVLGLRRVD
jgi:predicted ABC-type ATPase